MTVPIWEDYISLNSRSDVAFDVLGPAQEYVEQDDGSVTWDESFLSRSDMLARDRSPLPIVEHREGYYGPNHFNYWASGLRDYVQLLEWTRPRRLNCSSILDIGCATGRLVRHVEAAVQVETVYGCDINRLHIDWIGRH